MMKKKLTLLLCLLLTASIAASCAYLPFGGYSDMYSVGIVGGDDSAGSVNQNNGDMVTISKADYERYKKFDKLIELMEMANTYFYQDVDSDAMLDGAASGLLSALGDPYTFYYTTEEYSERMEDDKGEYAGVGIQISASYLTGICTVSRVFDNGPAKAAGVHKGDILYKVGDELFVDAYNLDDAVSIMRGTPGTDVQVTFLRNGEEMTFTLTRQKISVNRIDSMMLTEDVGYIFLYEFAGDCAEKFEEALKLLVKQGAKGIIIDLRDNPGGWVDDAEAIGDLFLDAGTLCYLEYKDGAREYYITKDGKTDVELVVLVNEHSASASEILSGALQDREDATVVGVQSYGKGIVQVVVPLSQDGSAMQMTIAQYFTPNGNAVHKIGITPNVTVELPEGDNGMYQFGDLADPQLSKALEIMQQKLAK